MSRARLPGDGDSSTVTISQEGEWYVAHDQETGVASQGRSRHEALANLAEAIELHQSPIDEDLEVEEPDAPWFDDEE